MGLPLGPTRPSLQGFPPVLSRIESRFGGISNFLSYLGRLILVNSVFLALPTFYMCSLNLPLRSLSKLTDIGNTVFGVGVISIGRFLLGSIETACRTKGEGGLGIINLKNYNLALLLMHLHNFYNHADIPWVSLTWTKLYRNTQLLILMLGAYFVLFGGRTSSNSLNTLGH